MFQFLGFICRTLCPSLIWAQSILKDRRRAILKSSCRIHVRGFATSLDPSSYGTAILELSLIWMVAPLGTYSTKGGARTAYKAYEVGLNRVHQGWNVLSEDFKST